MFILKSFLFVACFLLSNSVSQDFSVTPISTSSGLYFEKIGKVLLSNDNWEFVTAVNYEGYLLFYQYLLERAREIKELCEMLDSNTCKDRYAGIQLNLDRIQQVDESMATFLEVTTDTKRVKGFWMEIGSFFTSIGRAVISVFGGGSNVDLSLYSLAISDLQNEQQQLQNEFQFKRTIFMKQEENQKRLEEEVEKIKKNFLDIDNSVKELKNDVANNSKDIYQLQRTSQLNEISTNFILLINQLQSEQQVLFKVIKNVNMGHLDPYILTPSKLMDMLINIQEYLPEGTNFPYYLNIKNSKKLYKIIKPSVYLFDDKLIFILQMPLVYSKTFNLHKITSLPVVTQNNTFVFILPQEPFIVVDDNYQDYMLMSKDIFISHCSDLETTRHLCRQAEEMFHSQDSKECEVNLFKSPKMVPETCNKRIMALNNSMFIQLQRDRSWIYVVPTVENIIVSCGKNRTNLSLERTGFIRVDEKCFVIMHNEKPLQSFAVFANPVESDFSPSLNLTDFITQFDDVKVKGINSVGNISFFEFKKLEEISYRIEENETNWVTWVASSIGVVVFIVLFCLVACEKISIEKCSKIWERYNEAAQEVQDLDD